MMSSNSIELVLTTSPNTSKMSIYTIENNTIKKYKENRRILKYT